MRYFIVDAFSDTPFGGNQAGVCLPEAWPPDALMQRIARENNLSETAFAVKSSDHYGLRWFTPAVEIELCGHATLATAFALFSFVERDAHTLSFHTRSGVLTVSRKGKLLEMDFPQRTQRQIEVTEAMRRAVGVPVLHAYAGYNLMLELESPQAVRALKPDIGAIKALSDYHGVIVTATGEDCDFVSRFFAPNVGIEEDPVTGSTHTSLAPYWGERLKKRELIARQLSERGGMLWCALSGDRVLIAGNACLYLSGEIHC